MEARVACAASLLLLVTAMDDGIFGLWVAVSPTGQHYRMDAIGRAFVNAQYDNLIVAWMEERNEDPTIDRDFAKHKILGWTRVQHVGPYTGVLEAEAPEVRAMTHMSRLYA